MSRSRMLVVMLIAVGCAVLVGTGVAAAAPGDLDPTFGTGGVRSLATGTQLYGVAVQSDRQVVAVGSSGTSQLVERFSAAGAAERAFSAGAGVGRAAVIQADGKIVVAGNNSAGVLVERFNTNGTLDGTFGSHGVVHAAPGGIANAVALGPNGTIVAAGQVPGVDGFQRIAVLRLNSNGSPDKTLGTGGLHVVDLGQDSIARGVAVQGDGKIVLAGQIGPGAHQVTNALVARVTSTGTLDTTFSAGGRYLMAPQAGGGEVAFNALALDPGGAIVAAGGATTTNQSEAVFARLSCSGALDHGFAGSGVQLTASSRAFQTNDYGANGVAVVAGRRVVGTGRYQDSGLASATLWGFQSNGAAVFGKMAPSGAEGNALAVDSTGDLVVAGTNIPAGFAPSGFVARYTGFGGPATGTGQCGGAITTAPALNSVGQSHRSWGEAKSKKNKKRAVGTKFSFTLSQAARVTFTFTQRASGRKVGGKCVAQTTKNRHKASCKRTVTDGSLSVNGHAGKNTLSFKGKIGKKKLKLGTYTVKITAKGATKSRSLTFKIVS